VQGKAKILETRLQLKVLPFKAVMDRKAYKVPSSIKLMELSKMGGTLTSPTAPQVTDVSPNRWGEPVNRPKGTLAL
jgi:hypothetical protein